MHHLFKMEERLETESQSVYQLVILKRGKRGPVI
jgi:hypothetical protein